MKPTGNRQQAAGVALALAFVCYLGLYLLTLTRVHTFDALSYILDVDRKPWPELFHPHHLAYGPLGALVRAVAQGFGWRGSAATLIQTTNALAGAAGVAIFCALIYRLSGHASLAGIGALLLGSSYAFWYYAVEVEVYTIATLFLIIALALLAALARRPAPGIAAALGVAQGMAILFHQTNVLLCLPVGVTLLLADQRPMANDTAHPARRSSFVVGLTLAYALPLGAIVAGAYLWVGLGVSGFRSWAALAAWMEGYARTGWWGGALDASKLAKLGTGLSETVAQPGGTLIGLGLLAVLLANMRGLRRVSRGLLWALLAWLASYGAFFLWWEPDNIEFWIASLPAFFMLLLLGVAGRQTTNDQRPTPNTRRGLDWSFVDRQWSTVALLALGLAMLLINLGAISRRGDAKTDLQRVVTDAIVQHSGAGDLLVVPDGLLELYLPYYADRTNVTSLNQAMTASGGDWPAACALLRGRVTQALESGYGVLLAAEAMRPIPAPPGEPPTMMERFGLTPGQVAECYAPLAPMMSSVGMGAGLPGYSRIPAAQAIADGDGWDFSRGAWGWRAANVGQSAISRAGWVQTPGVDPSMSSPLMDLAAERYGAIEIRMAATTAARDAQLFFLDPSGRADEERSLRFQLAPGGELHTYRLELRGAPGWSGQIGGLRLDPVGQGDGGTVTVASIRLLR